MNPDRKAEQPHETVTITGPLERGIDHIDRALTGGKNLMLDFSQCPFISVDGLEWLEEFLMRAQSTGLAVRIVNARPAIYKVFKVARINIILAACGAPSTSGPVC